MIKFFPVTYKKLYNYFGPQRWWPAKTPFEVMVGAILTQNTSWQNVEKAIKNLKKHKLLSPGKLNKLKNNSLALRIKPAGYYNVKAKRLKNFIDFLFKEFGADIGKMRLAEPLDLRKKLIAVNGIGQETADSILLYALNKPVFVVDAYTRRILCRHGKAKKDAAYEEIQGLFVKNLRNNAKLFNEYHALLVRLGKEFCFKNDPQCKECPLK